MKFIQVFNEDGSNNSLLNVDFIAKINNGVKPLEIKGNKFYQIEYSLGYRYEEAYISEKDYLELTKAEKPKVEKQTNTKGDTKWF